MNENPNLTTAQLKSIRKAIDEALAAVAEKHGLQSLQCGSCKYTPDGAFTFQLKGLISGGLSQEASLYNTFRQYNPDLPELGTIITATDGKKFKITGLNTTGTKVFGTEVVTGKAYQFPTEAVKRLYKAQIAAKSLH